MAQDAGCHIPAMNTVDICRAVNNHTQWHLILGSSKADKTKSNTAQACMPVQLAGCDAACLPNTSLGFTSGDSCIASAMQPNRGIITALCKTLLGQQHKLVPRCCRLGGQCRMAAQAPTINSIPICQTHTRVTPYVQRRNRGRCASMPAPCTACNSSTCLACKPPIQRQSWHSMAQAHRRN
jgi:hypothetical protein